LYCVNYNLMEEHYKNYLLEDIPNEVWKDVINYDGYYQVSNMGRVKSLKKWRNNGNGGYIQKEHILHQASSGKVHNGMNYQQCCLSVDGVKKHFNMQQIVAIHFVDNPNNYKEVNHIDGNKKNNVWTNLEWTTRQANQLHMYKMGLSHGRPSWTAGLFGKDNPHSKIILQLDMMGNPIKEWESLNSASKELKINVGNIGNACRGRCKSVGGFKWQYKQQLAV
jgi:hypothetical protein